jgi:uncharacterized membrane protein YdjX (TVP38/TMEM64 family)
VTRPARSHIEAVGRSLIYFYHPIVTKLFVSFVLLGLLLLIIIHPEGRTAMLEIRAALDDDVVLSIILLTILFALSTLSVYFPEFLVTVAAGFLLGAVPGAIFSVIAITVCASVNFWIARRYGNHVIHLLFDSHSRAEIRWTATRITRMMVFLTWVLPSINFDLISYAAGLSAMSYPTFLALSISGNMISSLILAFLGSALRSDASIAAVLTLVVYTIVGTVLYAKELPARFLAEPEV